MPVYNENVLLAEAVGRCVEVLSKNCRDYEMILIDDGSNDGTSERMIELARVNDRVKVIHNHINLNIGISIQRGFAIASKEYVIFDSVDLPLVPEDIPGIVEKMDDLDMLVLERETYAGAISWRRLTSRINISLLRLLFPFITRGYNDLNYTFIFRKSIWPRIVPIGRSPAFVQPEIILRALYQGFRVGKLPVAYHRRPSGRGSLGKPHDIIWTLYDMCRFRLLTLHKTWGVDQ